MIARRFFGVEPEHSVRHRWRSEHYEARLGVEQFLTLPLRIVAVGGCFIAAFQLSRAVSAVCGLSVLGERALAAGGTSVRRHSQRSHVALKQVKDPASQARW